MIKGVRVINDIVVEKLYTVHYFEYSKTYKFIGESHDFWEMVYADTGDINIFTEKKNFILHRGEAVFHKPNEWHNLAATSNAPSAFIITFSSRSKAMEFFNDKILSVNQMQKELISKILDEYTNAFSTPLNDPFTNYLTRNTHVVVGSEQLLLGYLCELLISFMRSDSKKAQTLININAKNSLLDTLIEYMQNNIRSCITIDDLLSLCGSNKTTVTKLFREKYNLTPIDYFTDMKMKLAKRLLREDEQNITQIADYLGFSSVHYFSRCFKKREGLTPSQYSGSVKALTAKVEEYDLSPR